jgi:hypothetical protein
MTKAFTHIGTLSGDARTGQRKFRTKLRLTPSGSHWVDTAGRKYRRRGGGYVGDKWPLYFLDVDSIQEITASGMSASGQDPKGLEAKPASPVDAEGSETPNPSIPSPGSSDDV